MKGSLFRFGDLIEAGLVFFTCLIATIIFAFLGQNFHGEESYLAEFIFSILEHQETVALALTLLALIFIYQFIKRRQLEVRLRFLVGARMNMIRLGYLCLLLASLLTAFFLTICLGLLLSLSLQLTIEVFLFLLVYCLVSMIWVRIDWKL